MQGGADDPRAPLGGNFRPVQALNGRSLRTNVFLSSDKVCASIRLINAYYFEIEIGHP